MWVYNNDPAYQGWDNSGAAGYPVTGVSGDTVTVSGVPSGLPSCDINNRDDCGSAADHNWQVTENFTLAGGYDQNQTTSEPYYDLYADFWNTWQQAALTRLEDDCLNGTSCDSDPNIEDNDQVDQLP